MLLTIIMLLILPLRLINTALLPNPHPLGAKMATMDITSAVAVDLEAEAEVAPMPETVLAIKTKASPLTTRVNSMASRPISRSQNLMAKVTARRRRERQTPSV